MFFSYPFRKRFFKSYLRCASISAFIFILFMTAAISPIAYAQETAKTEKSTSPSPAITKAELLKKIETINKTSDLSPEAKQKINSFYQKAIESLDKRQKAISQIAQYSEMLKKSGKGAPQDTGIVILDRPATIEYKAKAMALSEVEGEIARLQTELAQEQTNVELSKKNVEITNKRPEDIRAKIVAYEKELSTLEAKLTNQTTSNERPRVTKAKQISIKAKRNELKAELSAALKQAELVKQKSESSKNNLAKATRKASKLQELIKTWKKVYEEHQSDVGYAEWRQAKIILRGMDQKSWPKSGDFLRPLAKNNLGIAKTIIEINQKKSQAKKSVLILKERLTQLQSDFKLTRRHVKMMGLSRKSGKLLQERRATLQMGRANSKIAKKRNAEIINASMASDYLQREIQNFFVVKNKVYNKLDKISGKAAGKDDDILTTSAFMVIDSYRKLLEEAGKSYSGYVEVLNSQQVTQKKINTISLEYRNYINQRLLWALSASILSPYHIVSSRKSIAWLTSYSNWNKLAKDFKLSVSKKPSMWGLLLFSLIAFILLIPRFGRQIRTINKRIEKNERKSVQDTLVVMLLTILQTASIPIIICIAASQIYCLNGINIFSRAFCLAVFSIARIVIILAFINKICSSQNTGEIHFGWAESTCKLTKRIVKAIYFTVLPVLFFVIMIQRGPQNLNYRSTLGRLLFILGMILILFIMIRGIKRSKKLIKSGKNNKSVTLLTKYRKWWLSIIIAIPTILIIITILGYYFTAYELAKAWVQTVCLILVLVVIKALINRILYFLRKKFVQKKAKTEQEIKKLCAQKENENAENNIDMSVVAAAATIDIEKLDEKTSQLAKFVILVFAIIGIFLIWRNIFPALNLLNTVELWRHGTGVVKNGKAVLRAVTLLNLINAFIIFAVTMVAVRSMSAITEILALKSSNIDPGSRHAYGLISKYIVSAIGIFAGLSAMGIGWSQFQYIAAAMTLGLSFGLQDIFANFISGIIILFERPIRLGDSVTVSGSSGVVSRIRIRSTTITDWDRRELIVPNKTFLAEKITNWSLSDPITRIVIEVGIGYSSDAPQAEKVLLKIAQDSPLVKKEPAPSVIFNAFGADSLDFNLRAFVDLPNRMMAQHQIRHEINKRFKEAGIEIPFAQRDIHINSAEGPLKINIVDDKKK